jgi:hypothetical protein
VLYSWPLHEGTEIFHSVDQVRPRVRGVAEAADELAVQGCILLLCLAIAIQFEALFMGVCIELQSAMPASFIILAV